MLIPSLVLLRSLFERMGFPVTARHRSKNVTLHKQGDVNFIINVNYNGSPAQAFVGNVANNITIGVRP